MAQPASLASQFRAELRWPNVPTDLRLRAILRDSRRALSSVSSALAADLYFTIGLAETKLKNYQSAVDAFVNARRLGVPAHEQVQLGINIACGYLHIGSVSEAISELEAAMRIASTAREKVIILANLAEAHLVLGDIELSNSAFQRAIHEADFSDPESVHALANQAAEIGAEADALHLYQMFLAISSRDTLDSMSEGTLELLSHFPVLDRCVRGAIHIPEVGDSGQESPDHERVYLEMAPARARANATVMQ